MADRSPERFELLLPGDAATFRDDGTSMFGLWPDFRIAWVNRGYLAFAAANEGHDIATRWREGARLWDAVGEPLTAYYRPHFERLLREGRGWASRYDCSTPTRYRLNRMTVSPVGDRAGLLVVNATIEDAGHATEPSAPSDVYVEPGGLVRMCANCRRVHRADREAWDWVPAWVKRVPATVTHGLCPLCAQFLYGDVLKGRKARRLVDAE
jgi:hypothetical protein